MKSDSISVFRKNMFLYLLVLVGSIVYISLIFNQNVWLDEAFTASLVNTSFSEVLQRSMQDTLPPLYNLLLKCMTSIFGYKILVMKLTSVIPMILTMLLAVTTVKKRFGYMVAGCWILCLFTMPCMLFYGVEIRMYSWGFFFATASGVFLYEVICDSTKKNWILFTLYSVGAGYTHHFAFVTVGFVYLALLLYFFFYERHSIKKWLLCLLATFLLYIPCLVVTIKQLKRVSGYFSMPEVTPSVFIKYMYYPYVVGNPVVSVLLTLLMLVLVLFLLRQIFIKKEKDIKYQYALCCFLIYYGVLCFGSIISNIMTANIFVDRYLFFAMGLLWLFLSIIVTSLKKPLPVIILLFILMIGLIGYHKEWQIEYESSPNTMLSFLDSKISSDDGVISFEDSKQIATCMTFYYPQLTYYDSEKMNLIHGTVWCVVMDGYESEFEEFMEAGFHSSLQGEFEFDRYSFKLYIIEPEDGVE